MIRRQLKKHLFRASFFLFSAPSLAAVKVPIYQVIAPTSDVAGLKTVSTNIGGNQGGAMNADIIADIQNKDLGKVKKGAALAKLAEMAEEAGPDVGDLGAMFSLRELPVYEPLVDILTLRTMTTDGEIQITGSAVSVSEVKKDGQREVSAGVMHDCVKVVVSFEYDVKIVAATGAPIGQISDALTRESLKSCAATEGQAKTALPSAVVLLKRLRKQGVEKVVGMVKPKWSMVEFTLEKDKAFGKAVKSIKHGSNVGQSYEQILHIHQTDPANHEAAFSVAVIMEMYGDLDNAKTQYEKAGTLKQTKAQDEALLRVQQRVEQSNRLKAMGLNVRGAPPAGDGGRLLAIKTSRSKRIALTSEPGGGTKVTEVPGKISVTILEESGAFCKVKTPTDQVGWIETAKLK
jgi:hypothetical protein